MSIIIMLLLISLLVLVHELGHFSVARLLKIRVDRFGFGLPFGPTLWEKKIGDVTYCIHAFLLGGYVSFPDDDPDSDIPADDPGRLMNRKIWERALVISAGVVANALLAYLIIIGVVVFTKGVPTDFDKIYIEGFVDENPIAQNAGFKKGDKILAINNTDINSFIEFKKILLANRNNDKHVSNEDLNKQIQYIVKDNPSLMKFFNFPLNNASESQLNEIKSTVVPKNYILNIPEMDSEEFLMPDLKDPFSSPDVLPESSKIDDSTLKLNTAIVNNKFVGNGYTTIGEIAKVAADGSHLLNITVDRDGKKFEVTVSPDKNGQLGIFIRKEEVFVPVKSIGQVLTGSWDYLYSKTELMCLGLYKIFTGKISLWDLHGIVAITKIGGQIIQHKGMVDGWLLTALISIDLAIINLLPIPALDGGHLLFLFIEKLRGRPIEEKYQEAILKYGFLFLIGLMIFIIFNDILGIVTGKF